MSRGPVRLAVRRVTDAGPSEWAEMPSRDLRGFSVRPGLSFSSMLREYIQQLPGQPKLLPRDFPPGPVTFTPSQ